MAKHTICQVCWAPEVLTTGIDRCDECEKDWNRIVKAHNELIARFPAIRKLSIAGVYEYFVGRALGTIAKR